MTGCIARTSRTGSDRAVRPAERQTSLRKLEKEVPEQPAWNVA